MSEAEWESICDGCAKCCLLQLEDEKSGDLVFTDVACHLLDRDSCRCQDYSNRSERVPGCLAMNRDNVKDCAAFAPPSCAYRVLLQGESLPEWHHLRSGSRQTVHHEGRSVRGRIRSERQVRDTALEEYVVSWPEQV